MSHSFLQQKRVQFLLTKLYKNTVNVNPDFYVPFFKRKKVPYNIKMGSIVFQLNHKLGSFWYRFCTFPWLLKLKFTSQLFKIQWVISKLKNNRKHYDNIDCGCLICRLLIFYKLFLLRTPLLASFP